MMTSEPLEKEILHQQSLNRKVKCFVHCNPSNPLGVMYDKKMTLDLMRVCAKYKVHFLSDEIYALSVFGADDGEQFESVLALRQDEVN